MPDTLACVWKLFCMLLGMLLCMLLGTLLCILGAVEGKLRLLEC